MSQQQQQQLSGLLGRLGFSRGGHGSLAGSPYRPVGFDTGAAGTAAEIQGDVGGGGGAVKLREVEDESVGDYLAAKGPDGPSGGGALSCDAKFVLRRT